MLDTAHKLLEWLTLDVKLHLNIVPAVSHVASDVLNRYPPVVLDLSDVIEGSPLFQLTLQ